MIAVISVCYPYGVVFDLFWLYRFSGCGTSCVMTPDPSSFVSQCTVLQAPVLLRNLSNHNVNISNSVTLRCLARGIPHPRITWYKDQRKLQQVSGETRNVFLSIFILYVNKLHMFFFIGRYYAASRERDSAYWPNYSEDQGLYTCKATNERGSVESSAHILGSK